MLLFLLTLSDEEHHRDIKAIYNKHHNYMMRYAIGTLRSAGRKNYVSEAEDAVQNAFMKIVKHVDKIDFSLGEASVKNYCVTILHNEIFKILRESEILFENIEEFCLENEYNFIEELEIKERYDEVVEAIRGLDEKYSSTLYFVYCEERTVDEIAEMMGISRQTVYTRLSRGKKLLLDSLKGANYDG